MTDRRSSIRFEIVGRLPGALAIAQPVRLHDISPGGALVEMSSPLSVDSQHSVQLSVRGHLATVDARVRHVRPAIDMGRFLIGFEFITPAHVIDEALATTSDQDRA